MASSRVSSMKSIVLPSMCRASKPPMPKARWIGHKLHADVAIRIDEDMPLSAANKIAASFAERTVRTYCPRWRRRTSVFQTTMRTTVIPIRIRTIAATRPTTTTGRGGGPSSYAGLLVSALLAATILPMQSEGVLGALLLGGTYSTAGADCRCKHRRYSWRGDQLVFGARHRALSGPCLVPGEAACARPRRHLVSSLWQMVAWRVGSPSSAIRSP